MELSLNGLFQICDELFRNGLSAHAIAQKLQEEKGLRLSRQEILPKLHEAYREGVVQLIPPRHRELEAALAEEFALDADRLWVVNVGNNSAADRENRWAEIHVPAAAADLVLQQIRRMSRQHSDARQRIVGLGLGPGRATLEFSRFLGQRLHADPEAPKLNLIAITGGSVPTWPQYAPLSFFNLFPAELVEKEFGLFAEMLVEQAAFNVIKRSGVGIKEAFAARNKVDIIVTAMGDFKDEHDLFKEALQSGGETIGDDWVGNVQYRGYTAKGPVLQRGKELRAVTLFELKDFVELARDPSKCVVLLARCCSVCGRTKAAALRPLLEQPGLRVFSHLVMDLATGWELLKAKSPGRVRIVKQAEGNGTRGGGENDRKAFTFWLCDALIVRNRGVQDFVDEVAATGHKVARESVYPRLAKAGPELGLVEVVEPLESKLAHAVAVKFGLPVGQIRVVDVADPRMEREVAAVAAQRVLALAEGFATDRERPMCLGFGPGRATLDFAKHLGRLLRRPQSKPSMNLIAISAGCVPDYPAFAAESFFNLFPEHAIGSSTGLFAEALVRKKDFDKIVREKRPGVGEALQKRDLGLIDVVVAAIGDLSDEHDLLGMLLKRKVDDIDVSWVGSVQQRPYTKMGPVEEGADDWRAVTLFELPSLAMMAARRDKHVVLIARQCRMCKRTKANALRPLLVEPSLRVWSELVMDVATARDLVRGP